MPFVWGLLYKAFYRVFAAFSYVKIPLDAGDFSLMDRRVVGWLLNCGERDLFVRGLRAYVGFRQAGVDYVRPERAFGRSTNNLLKNIEWAKRGIFSFSNTPLTMLTTAGMLGLVLTSVLLAIQIALQIFVPNIAPQGVTTVLIVTLLFGSFNLFAIGLVGEYVGEDHRRGQGTSAPHPLGDHPQRRAHRAVAGRPDSHVMRACPVCGAGTERASLFLPERIDESGLSEFSFASRKVPEFMNHRLVRCEVCDLVYVPAPPKPGTSSRTRTISPRTTARKKRTTLPRRTSTRCVRSSPGFRRSVPPWRSARAAARCSTAWRRRGSRASRASNRPRRRSPRRRRTARHASRTAFSMRSDFAPESFDLICCLMTMEHVPDPNVIAAAARRLLRPGGAFVTVTHDYRAMVNRLLGRRSPIIDVEHMQLFSRRSIVRLFESNAFRGVTAKPLVNRYPVAYWVRLGPLPPVLKSGLQSVLARIRADRVKLAVNVGNVLAAGFK